MSHSAKVSARLVVGDLHVKVAKTNGDSLTLAEECELAPKTEAQLSIVIDERKSTQLILLSDGATAGQREVRYWVLAHF
jgi:hypothetical protein